MFFKSLGDHLFSAISTDLIGNATTSDVVFRVIATPDSTISDIERAFALGWITTEKTKSKLLKKIEAAIRIEQRIEELIEKLPDGSKKIKRIGKLEKKLDKILGKQILEGLEKERNKTIDEQAYQLLKEDILWILNN